MGTWSHICCQSPNQGFCRKVGKGMGHPHPKRRRITAATSSCSAALPTHVSGMLGRASVAVAEVFEPVQLHQVCSPMLRTFSTETKPLAWHLLPGRWFIYISPTNSTFNGKRKQSVTFSDQMGIRDYQREINSVWEWWCLSTTLSSAPELQAGVENASLNVPDCNCLNCFLWVTLLGFPLQCGYIFISTLGHII